MRSPLPLALLAAFFASHAFAAPAKVVSSVDVDFKHDGKPFRVRELNYGKVARYNVLEITTPAGEKITYDHILDNDEKPREHWDPIYCGYDRTLTTDSSGALQIWQVWGSVDACQHEATQTLRVTLTGSRFTVLKAETGTDSRSSGDPAPKFMNNFDFVKHTVFIANGEHHDSEEEMCRATAAIEASCLPTLRSIEKDGGKLPSCALNQSSQLQDKVSPNFDRDFGGAELTKCLAPGQRKALE